MLNDYMILEAGTMILEGISRRINYDKECKLWFSQLSGYCALVAIHLKDQPFFQRISRSVWKSSASVTVQRQFECW